jgi:AcrR family transcriptional regulator
MTVENNKLTTRKIQAIHTKKQILDTALKLIAKCGYDNVSINAICKEVGVSIGAFYHHFSAKEDIIIEGYRQVDIFFDEYVQKKLSNMKTFDKIIAFIQYQVEYATNLGVDVISQVYKAQLHHGTKFFISEERALPRNLRNIIKEGQENNEIIIDLSAEEIERQILRLSRGLIYDWCVHNGEYDLLTEAGETMDYFLRAFMI